MNKRVLEPGGAANAVPEPASAMNAAELKPFKVAIIGGGAGGLFTAWHLAAKVGTSAKSPCTRPARIGGKLETGQFPGIGPYEAGVAEIYDYSALGPDPLHDLIVKELGLEIKHIQGGPCVLDGKIVLETDDLAKSFGEAARDEALAFRQNCADLTASRIFYLSILKPTMLPLGRTSPPPPCSSARSKTTPPVAISEPWRTATSPRLRT